MPTLDDIDAEIIRMLREDGRCSFVSMGERLGVSEGAVRNRVKRLMASGIILRFTVETASTGVKGMVGAVVDVNTETSRAARTVSTIEGVRKVYEVSGDEDLLVLAEAKDISGLNECVERIRRVRGVERTRTLLVLKEH